ncbi:MAG TPA: GNAT family N-acetyltransferase [Casimicrobiaceae bacterium]|jgi:GNAT superfamily N-acetyltransferase|nr:GNAT family N-acetyltransferase [Casimicrobiaceae bacterium]
MIDIAPATPADLPDIHALIRALAEYEKLAAICTGTREALGEALFGAHPAADVLVARVDGAVAGFALFFPTFSTFLAQRGLWLEDLFVVPAMRGRGVGRALLAAVAGVARERRCGRLEWAVLDWNAPAIGFYEGLGATLMPEWRLARVTGERIARIAASSLR